MTNKTTLNINPKVFVGLLCGLGAAALGGILAYVSPETFSGLGAYEPAAFSVFSVLVGSGAAWLKREEAAEEAASASAPAARVAPAPAIPAAIEPAPISAEPTVAPTAFDALLAGIAAPQASTPVVSATEGVTITHAPSV